MFSFLGKEACPIHLYGKLPLAKDYLRVGAGSGSAQTLRDWLDRAFSQGANSKDPLLLPWPAALIAGESWGQPLCAAAWPSGDAGHLRPFPFTAFIERKKKPLLEDLERGWALSAAVWEKLGECYAAREAHDNGQSFLAAMRGREIALEALQPIEAERIDFEVWISALWPDTGKDGLLEFLRALEALRRANHRGPLRLPLVTNLPSRPQVQAWMRLLVEMNLVARDALPTLLFPLPAPRPSEAPPAEETPPSEDASAFSFDIGSTPSEEPAPDLSAESSDNPAPSDDPFTPESDPSSADSPSSEPAPAEPEAPAVEPQFLLVFRTTPAPADAAWLRAPAAKGARREGDLCPARGAVATSTEPASESVPPLADSLRGALAGLRGKLAR